MSIVERELMQRFARLGPAGKRQVLDYARSLGAAPGRGTPGAALLDFVGSIPPEDLREMAEAIEEGCERIDPMAGSLLLDTSRRHRPLFPGA